MRDIIDRLASLERQLATMVRIGIVDTVDREKCRATVCFPTRRTPDGQLDGPKTKLLPVLVKQVTPEGTRDYWMPEINQWVVVVALPTGAPGTDAFILGGWYSDAGIIPDGAAAKGMRLTEFGDGARFEYNPGERKLRVLVGDLEVEMTPDHIRFDGDQPYVRGNDHKALMGAILDLIAGHVHPTGVGPSGPPSTSTAFTAKKEEIPGTLSPIIKGR